MFFSGWMKDAFFYFLFLNKIKTKKNLVNIMPELIGLNSPYFITTNETSRMFTELLYTMRISRKYGFALATKILKW